VAGMISEIDITQSLNTIGDLVKTATVSSGRRLGSVITIAISKNHPVESLEQALDAGQRVFGENRVQEAIKKWPALKDKFVDVELHLVGSLQGNKVARAVEIFNSIHTIDSIKLARVVARIMEKNDIRPSCFIQVNTGEEPQKGGIFPIEADAFIAECRDDIDLPIKGLMCVPPRAEESALHFALLREIARRNGLECLSMGMSGDFEEAIRFGATHVRIGTAIFGNRTPRKYE
jgi:pyridoxal phosphate enzyme (YggS family)